MNKKNLKNLKGKKNRIALISGSGELPELIIRELTLNGIEPIVFSPIGLKITIPKNIDRVFFNLFDLEKLVYELKKKFIGYLVFVGKITRTTAINKTSFILNNFNTFKQFNINLSDTDDILATRPRGSLPP